MLNSIINYILDGLQAHLASVVVTLVNTAISALLVILRQKFAPSVATPLLPPDPPVS